MHRCETPIKTSCDTSQNKRAFTGYSVKISRKVISFWNKLPSFVRNSVSVIDFKINLEEFLKN